MEDRNKLFNIVNWFTSPLLRPFFLPLYYPLISYSLSFPPFTRFAEFFADVLLTPLEATRIRLVSDRTYAKGLVGGFMRMAKEGGLREFYAGFIPILFKQSEWEAWFVLAKRFAFFSSLPGAVFLILYFWGRSCLVPYAVSQFAINEIAHEQVYKRISAERRAALSTTEQTGITLSCGIVAVSTPLLCWSM